MYTKVRETYIVEGEKHIHFHNLVKAKITRSVLISDCPYFYKFFGTVGKMCQSMSQFTKTVIDCQYFSRFFSTVKRYHNFSEFTSYISILPVKLMFKFISTKWDY